MSTRRPPNILVVMVDQLAPQSLPDYGHKLVHTPNLSSLADNGVVFENFYCNSALCAPSRFSFMAGQRNSQIGAFDNAAEFPASIPTFAHYLRLAGYRTCLAGKMHFVGPDQLHGFEERITTDIYPGDFGWTPTWYDPEHRHWWFHNMLSVIEAGPYDRSLEIDYDEEVTHEAVRWIWDYKRGTDQRPFLLCTSLIHPHDPYMAPRRLWDLYRDEDIDMPRVPFMPPEKRDPFTRRMWEMYDRGEYEVTADHVRTARHGYYSMISFADELIGRLLRPLETLGLADNTVVMVVADHGDMLGERGQWFKMVFFERSIRVPLIMSWPAELKPRRVPENTSLIDILPTLADIATSGKPSETAVPIDGASLMPLARGEVSAKTGSWADTVYGEYLAEGTPDPVFMIKRGNLKFITAICDPPQLYDTAADPDELRNLAADRAFVELCSEFAKEAAARWHSDSVKREIIASQRARVAVQDALLTGRITPWDYEPRRDPSKLYNRNYGGELYDTDRRARVPGRPEPARRTRRDWSRDVK
jgi:choline-sulfatase